MFTHYMVYKDLLNNYRSLYGSNIILLFQVGCKYEIYGDNNKDIQAISRISGLVWMKKTKYINSKEPEKFEFYVTNIGKDELNRYVDLILKENFIVILYNEDNITDQNLLKTRYVSYIKFPNKTVEVENEYVLIPEEESYIIV